MTARVGLTGGIGSGKSSVAEAFRKYAIPVLSADRIAADLTLADSPCLAKIVRRFGRQVLHRDGALDRKRLGEIVFFDPAQRQWLEQLLHPPIRRRMQQLVEQAENSYCILEIPLLIESGQYLEMDRILVVHCPQENRIPRLMRTRNQRYETLLAIMQNQVSDARRLALADDVIDNQGTLSALAKPVEALHRKYLTLFPEPGLGR